MAQFDIYEEMEKNPNFLDSLIASGYGGEGVPDVSHLGKSPGWGYDVATSLLDAAGTVPVLGEPFELLSGLLSSGLGQYGDAALAFASVIPFADLVTKPAKYLKRYKL